MAQQQYPTKPITITVMSPPGGGMDICVRALTSVIEKNIGQPFIIENNYGGSGTAAFTLVAKQKPDGYRLLGGSTNTFVYIPHLRKVPYKVTDLVPIAFFGKVPPVGIAVKADAPWKTLKDLLAYAKANPGKITYAHGGVGIYLSGSVEAINAKKHVKWTGIPYKGSAEAGVALLGGQVDFASMSIYEHEDQFKTGKLRLIAVNSDTRCALAPDVPTIKEMGYGYSSEMYVLLATPKGTPPAIIKKLEDAINKGTKDPTFAKTLTNIRSDVIFMGSVEAKKYVDSMYARMGELLKNLNIPTEK
jgi:tripartite-type tricarboxylate transporter receptor subunit TctC